MLVAVTGANGFLGASTTEALRRAGHRVRAFVRPQTPREHVKAYVDEWCVGNQNEPRALTELVAGADAVVHIAMDWSALNSGPIPSLESNLLPSLRLLEAARTAQVPQFLFVSTLDVYHEIVAGRPLNEDHPAHPGSIYGAFKAAIEVHLKAYHSSYGLNASSWRPATMYGINSDIKRSLWFDLAAQAKRGERIATNLAGNVVWVRDVAEALTLAIGDPSVAGQFYNLVDTQVAWRTVAEVAKALSNSHAVIENVPDQGTYLFDALKAKSFFDRHSNPTALRRGMDGIRMYVAELMSMGF